MPRTLLLALVLAGATPARAELIPGTILVTDFHSLGVTGAVIAVDPATGAQTIISQGGNFANPAGIAVVPQPSTVIPEPASLLLLTVGASSITAGVWCRRRRHAARSRPVLGVRWV